MLNIGTTTIAPLIRFLSQRAAASEPTRGFARTALDSHLVRVVTWETVPKPPK